MLDRQAIRKEIDEILQTSLYPLSTNELVNQIKCRMKFPEIDITQFYSPHRQYAVSERLFHPAPKYLAWFTVAEPVTSKNFEALFDNGTVSTLRQNEPKTGYYNFIPETVEQFFEKFIADTLKEYYDDFVVAKDLYVSSAKHSKIPFTQLSNLSALKTLAKWRSVPKEPTSKELLRELCKKYQLDRLYYLTLLGNLPSILDRGILAYNLAPKERESFANEEIQAKRHQRCPDPRLQLTLHDYVPLFFAPKPPLLYALQEKQQHLVYLLVNPVVLLEPGVVFSSINAVSSGIFYSDVAALDRLNWPILQAEYWRSTDEETHDQNKLYRQAEAEIPVTVPVEQIMEIVAYNKSALDRVQREIDARNLPIKARVDVDEELFY